MKLSKNEILDVVYDIRNEIGIVCIDNVNTKPIEKYDYLFIDTNIDEIALFCFERLFEDVQERGVR